MSAGGPAAASASSRSETSSPTCSRSRPIRRAENAGASSLRIIVWFARSVSGSPPIGPPNTTDPEIRAAFSGSGCERPRRVSANSSRASS